MTSFDDVGKTILRNKLLGRWAAEQMGLTDQGAKAYSDALVKEAVRPEGHDVLSKIRKDFEAAGVAQSDEQILLVMTELTIKAGQQFGTSGVSLDAAAIVLKRGLMSR